MNELDEIMSGASDAASANTAEPTPTVEAPASEAAGQPRDETGRFASPQNGQSEAPAAIPEPNAAEHQEPGKGVPVAALQAEREKARAARDDAEALRREIAELRGMVTAQRQPAPAQPAATPAEPPTLWADPDGYVESRLSPIQQQLMDQREFLSETLAVQAHGAEVVDAAKKAIEQAARTPEGQQIISKLMQSRHPFNDLVSWHKQQAAIQRVGNDPDAWLEAEMEKRLSDPTYQAQILERIRGSAAQNTSRAQPVTNIPPSLSRMPGGANAAADSDMSDGSLFSHATR